MFQNINFDEKTLENAMFRLQAAGLDLNEYKNGNKELPVGMYEELLNFSIETLSKVMEYHDAVEKTFDQFDKLGKSINKLHK